MTASAVLRLLIYAALGLVALFFVFVVLLMVAMLLFGIALVRADLFALLAGAYWVIGAPVVLFLAYRIAAAPAPETSTET